MCRGRLACNYVDGLLCQITSSYSVCSRNVWYSLNWNINIMEFENFGMENAFTLSELNSLGRILNLWHSFLTHVLSYFKFIKMYCYFEDVLNVILAAIYHVCVYSIGIFSLTESRLYVWVICWFFNVFLSNGCCPTSFNNKETCCSSQNWKIYRVKGCSFVS